MQKQYRRCSHLLRGSSIFRNLYLETSMNKLLIPILLTVSVLGDAKPPSPALVKAKAKAGATAKAAALMSALKKKPYTSVWKSPTIKPSQGDRSVVLAWDPNSEPDIMGYRLYWGTATGQYTENTEVLGVVTATAYGLTQGVNYFFAVTAFNTANAESLPSNEVEYSPGRLNPPEIMPFVTPTPNPKPVN